MFPIVCFRRAKSALFGFTHESFNDFLEMEGQDVCVSPCNFHNNNFGSRRTSEPCLKLSSVRSPRTFLASEGKVVA